MNEVKDFRNYLPWRNYGRRIHKGEDKELINYKIDTFNYISQMEAQIQNLNARVEQLEKELKKLC